jgi:tyrosine-protein phosphatase SIW14
MGWRLDTIIEEYTAYATPKSRESDIKYIRGFEVQSLSQLFRDPGRGVTSIITVPSQLSRARVVKMVAIALLMLCLYLWASATV